MYADDLKKLGVQSDVIVKMRHIESIRHRLSLIRTEEKKLEEAKLKLEKGRSDIQADCKHYLQHYYGDPAGGSDSGHHCDVCDKWLD